MIPETAWTVEMEHRVGAPPEIVFEYFTDPEKYRRWKGLQAELDPRPGGAYRVTMRDDVWVSGTYLAVERPHRLVMTWGFESSITLPEGMAQVEAGSSKVEFVFVPDGDGTIVRVRHTELPSEEARRVHTLGWNNYVGRLAVVLEGREPGEDLLITQPDALLPH